VIKKHREREALDINIKIMEYSHACFGSSLSIIVFSGEDASKIIQESFNMADIFEQKYSRFINGNFLSELNKNKSSLIDTEFSSLIKLCLQISKLSQGYFDITL
jgi:thiamine biosynthesis lipoprotein ApbE